ncbi:acetyl-coenzyme A carboxylase carboxyl transferase subunit alpha [Polymorphobacter glacialis]|uniref:Acetyl-coenzyme A carboxylase carboxyl transferase subunit alpha n=1 Tax=Sandarakinorhabdus glacialis TaxID=1614636 RepID=A0A916ZXY1_9SPHN|nr:acetyl-CoA carboxylase carboxyltransferase subunit alpha [Polymorphobacter glacialis]GGE18503.1 acetyl-coenzyme A carboxylase carboxyl transferase subunit alpha [Polymorphobacter glacialis]
MTLAILEFEKPFAAIQARAVDYRAAGDEAAARHADGAARRLMAETYARLTPWQKTQVARHPSRPHFTDIVKSLVEDFTPLAGDRTFGEDAAIIGGIGRLRGQDIPVMVIGQEKGNDTASRVKHNFGMGRPEGYRKAIRLVEMAGRFNVPVITLIDSPGAYPGIDSEERGVAEAIARSTQVFLDSPVPIIAAITGEGMSGGAIALAAANRLIMFEHAIYAVITPEGCASILWRTAAKPVPTGAKNAPVAPASHAPEAAEAMRVTATDLRKLGVIDTIVSEPLGGAHRDHPAAIAALSMAITAELTPLLAMDPAALRKDRRNKFVEMGRLL